MGLPLKVVLHTNGNLLKRKRQFKRKRNITFTKSNEVHVDNTILKPRRSSILHQDALFQQFVNLAQEQENESRKQQLTERRQLALKKS